MLKKAYLVAFFFIFLIYMESLFKILAFKKILDISLLNIVLLSLPICLFIYLISSFFKIKINKVIMQITLGFITFIYISQLIYFKTYDSVFSFSAAGQANAIVEFIDFVFHKIISNFIGILLLSLPFILFLIFKDKWFDFTKIALKPRLILITSIIFVQIIAVKTLSGDDTYSSYNLYYNVQAPTLMANKLGIITTMRLDVKRAVFGFESDAFYNTDDKPVNKEEEKKIEYNTMEINWNDLIDNESNSTLKTMHQYFKNTTPTNKNEYTGLFKGKNLIWIIAESFDYIAIDPVLTPTLYKLSNEGMNFTNFYTPVFLSTIDGEYITQTGLIPKESAWSLYRSRENYLPFTLGNQMRGLGYKTTAYHNGEATYYHRNLSHPNLGFDFYACYQGLKINCKSWPQSDIEMIDATAKSYISKDQPFLTYYLTISGHLRYNTNNSMAVKNWDKVKDLPYSTPIKCYLAQHIELDKAIEKLIAYLEEAGVAEDTVIAISADHWPYGLTPQELNERSDNNRNDAFERDRMPFMIWHKGIKAQEIDKLGSSIDILPTLSNLFGIEYDSRLLMGRDLFSNYDPIVIYANRSWITTKGKYNAVTKDFISLTDEVVTESDIDNINKIIYNRFNISKLILEQDYYEKVFK